MFMDWADFLQADFDAIIFIRPTLHFLLLAYKCQSLAVVLVSPLAVAGRILWSRVCPSFPSEICLSVFLKKKSLDFSGFFQGTRNPYEVVHDNPIFFWKTFLPQKLGKWPKVGFLNLKKNLVNFDQFWSIFVNFYWICSIINMFIIAVFLHKCYIWEKSHSWDVG